MKLRQIGPNETEVIFNNNVRVLFSYGAPCAAFVPDRGAVYSDRFFSKTTDRHVQAWLLRGDMGEGTKVSHGLIDNIVGGSR